MAKAPANADIPQIGLMPGDTIPLQLSLREIEMVHQGLDALIMQAQIVQVKIQAGARMAVAAKQQQAKASVAEAT